MRIESSITRMMRGNRPPVWSCLLLIILCLTGVSTSAEALELVLKDAVTVRENYIYMRDLVVPQTYSGEESQVQETLLATALCKAPHPGSSRSLSRKYIVMKLKNKDINVDTLRMRGARAVAVRREAAVLSLEELERIVREYLVEQYGIDLEKTSIYLENIREDLILPDGDIRYAIEEMPSGFKYGKFSFRLLLTINGAPYKKKIVSAKVTTRCPVVIAAQALKAREIIRAENLKVKELHVDDRDYYFTSIDDVVGAVATIVFRAGEPIKRAYVRERPLIRKGTLVSAAFNHKNMQLELKVRALEDGTQGSSIPVYSEETRKRFSATVISSDNVEVVL